MSGGTALPDDGRFSYRGGELAKLMGASPAFISEQIKLGNIRAVKIGRATFIARAEVERLLAGGAAPAPSDSGIAGNSQSVSDPAVRVAALRADEV